MPYGWGHASRRQEREARAHRDRREGLTADIRKDRRDRASDEPLTPEEAVTCMVCGAAGTTLNMGREEGGFLCFGCEVDRQVAGKRARARGNAVGVLAIFGLTAAYLAIFALA